MPEAMAMGINRGSIGENKLGDVRVFSRCVIVFSGVFGVYIIPKWLIKVPGPFAILFR